MFATLEKEFKQISKKLKGDIFERKSGPVKLLQNVHRIRIRGKLLTCSAVELRKAKILNMKCIKYINIQQGLKE